VKNSEAFDLSMAELRAKGPHAMTRWLHVKTGNVYVVVFNGLLEKDCTPMVGYRRDDGSPPVWFRPLTEFLDGRFLPPDPDGTVDLDDLRRAT
jgi:hypothetical protein